MQGPFVGMKFDVPNFNTAMLLGTWEKELWPLIYYTDEIKPTGIICIGAAEGYYAVGLARLFPDLSVIAFEQNHKYSIFLSNLVSDNNCKNVIVKGSCDRLELEHSLNELGENPLVFCDIEGGEVDLLDANYIHSLNHTHMIVEVHEMYVRDCEKKLLDRFSRTHSATVFKGKKRMMTDFPKKVLPLRLLSSRNIILNLMDEGRPYPMNWIYFEPNKSTH